MGNGSLVYVKGKGSISMNIKWSGKQIHDVLYVPDLEENVLSVGKLMENGYSLVFRDNYCKIYDKIESNQVVVEVKMIKRNFPLHSLQCIKKWNCRWFMDLTQKIFSLEFSWFKASREKGHGARPSWDTYWGGYMWKLYNRKATQEVFSKRGVLERKCTFGTNSYRHLWNN